MSAAKNFKGLAMGPLKGLIGCACLVFAASLARGEGGKVGEIFNMGAGARQLALGSAYTAAGHDASGVYYNPAGLGMLPNRHVLGMHAVLFEGSSYDFLGYAQNYKDMPGGWGFHVLRLNSGAVEGRDTNDTQQSFTYSEMALGFGSGIRGILLPKLSVGAGFKVLSRTLANSSDKLIGGDLGAQYGPFWDNRINTGFVVQNAVGFKTGDTDDTLPVTAKGGVEIKPIPAFTTEIDVLSGGEFRVGAEYSFGMLALRAGYDRENIVAGIGLQFFKALQLDIAMLRHSEFGMSNRISLGYQFGARKEKTRPQVFSEDFVAKGEAAFKAKDYLAAIENIERAIGLDPKLAQSDWGQKVGKLKLLMGNMNVANKPSDYRILCNNGEQSDIAFDAIKAYMDSKELKSILLAHAAYGMDTQYSVFEDLLMQLSKLTGQPVKKTDMLPPRALLESKLQRCAGAFYDKRYDSALRECEEALMLDDKNYLTWTRLGSSYFAIGDKERARSAYESALKLNPNDKSMLEFMKLQKWR